MIDEVTTLLERATWQLELLFATISRTYVCTYVVFTVIPRPVLIKRTSIDRFVERIWNRARMETEIAKLTRIAEKPQASQPESLAAELDSPMVSLCSKRSTMETWRL